MTSPNRLSPELREFLKQRVGSLESMQALTVLRSQPQCAVTAARVAAALHISDVAAAVALDSLVVSELVEAVPSLAGSTYRMAKLAPELDRPLDELMHAYWFSRVELLAEIAGNSIKRVRFHAHQLLREALRMERAEAQRR